MLLYTKILTVCGLVVWLNAQCSDPGAASNGSSGRSGVSGSGPIVPEKGASPLNAAKNQDEPIMQGTLPNQGQIDSIKAAVEALELLQANKDQMMKNKGGR